MDKTPVANRLHIGIFGRRNVGKSSLINALTNQNLAIVSPTAGTTTDPVYKTIEILPEPGPCVIIDTAGLDDAGELGNLRKEKTLQVLNRTDVALVILDPKTGLDTFELELIKTIHAKSIPILLIYNKLDTTPPIQKQNELMIDRINYPVFYVSSLTSEGIQNLRGKIKHYASSKIEDLSLLKGIVSRGDTVVLVIPIDASMPKGRLILPEVQTLRAVLDEDGHAVVCKEYELASTLKKLKKPPQLVITDSQVYHVVKNIVPESIKLTSFSMLFARYKGDFKVFLAGTDAIDRLKSHDKVLISEACTHHPQPDDIGRTKIPNMLQKLAGGSLHFDYAVATDFPNNLSQYQLIIMCGSCMINARQVKNRIDQAAAAGVPITNYGMVFAKLNGILERTRWLGTC